MAKEFAKSFYNSKKWKIARETYVVLRFGICERCGKPNSKQVHHKKYLSEENINNPEISLNFNNFELLCDTCHQQEHFEKYSPVALGLEFDSNGQLIKRDNKE